MRRLWTVAMVGILVASLAACGVEGEGDAEVMAGDQVPWNLLEPPPTTTTTTPGGVDIDLYFVDGAGLLRPVTRRLPTAPSLPEALGELGQAPSDAADLRTALPEGLVIDVTYEGGIATANLGEEFTTLPVSDQVLALAQIVFTLTARPGVGRVGFQLEGNPIPIPRGDGVVTTETVSRDAYANLVAPL